MNRTVILACSATKRRETSELSAIARYDGPQWRTLRRHLSGLVEPPLALSAEFGLISGYSIVPMYDTLLTLRGVDTLAELVTEQLLEQIRTGHIRGETLFYGGQLYRAVMTKACAAAGDRLGRSIPITYARGGIGQQLGQLKAFLTKEPVA